MWWSVWERDKNVTKNAYLSSLAACGFACKPGVHTVIIDLLIFILLGTNWIWIMVLIPVFLWYLWASVLPCVLGPPTFGRPCFGALILFHPLLSFVPEYPCESSEAEMMLSFSPSLAALLIGAIYADSTSWRKHSHGLNWLPISQHWPLMETRKGRMCIYYIIYL